MLLPAVAKNSADTLSWSGTCVFHHGYADAELISEAPVGFDCRSFVRWMEMPVTAQFMYTRYLNRCTHCFYSCYEIHNKQWRLSYYLRGVVVITCVKVTGSQSGSFFIQTESAAAQSAAGEWQRLGLCAAHSTAVHSSTTSYGTSTPK